MDEKPTDRDGESMSNMTDNYVLTNHPELNHTISILTTYAFPKTSQYYSSKGKECILDKYHNKIIEYFITNNINIDKFYNSSMNKSDFVTSAMKYITDKTPMNNTENINYNLQTAVKKLYTILHAHQHINHNKSLSEPSLDIIEEIKFNYLEDIQKNTVQQIQHKKKKRTSIKDEIVHELSRAKSEVIILKEVADETQKKLIDTEQEKLQLKYKISKISNVNKELEEKKQEILYVNRKLTDENEKLKQLVLDLKDKQNMNVNDYNVTDNMNINRGNSLSLSSYYHQSNIENESENNYNENDTTELLQLNDNDMNNLSMFYKKMKVKKKKKKNFWERLFEDFKCISLN